MKQSREVKNNRKWKKEHSVLCHTLESTEVIGPASKVLTWMHGGAGDLTLCKLGSMFQHSKEHQHPLGEWTATSKLLSPKAIPFQLCTKISYQLILLHKWLIHSWAENSIGFRSIPLAASTQKGHTKAKFLLGWFFSICEARKIRKLLYVNPTVQYQLDSGIQNSLPKVHDFLSILSLDLLTGTEFKISVPMNSYRECFGVIFIWMDVIKKWQRKSWFPAILSMDQLLVSFLWNIAAFRGECGKSTTAIQVGNLGQGPQSMCTVCSTWQWAFRIWKITATTTSWLFKPSGLELTLWLTNISNCFLFCYTFSQKVSRKP